MRVRLTAELDPKAKRRRPDLDKGVAHEKALGHESGAALFRSSCPSPNSGYRFWLLALTFRSSRPAYGGRLTLFVSTTETLLYLAHVYSNGIQFLKRCSALGLSFLWASPAGVTLVCGLFGLWPLCSKRKQLLFSQCCAASVAQRFSAVRARRQAGVSRFGVWV